MLLLLFTVVYSLLGLHCGQASPWIPLRFELQGEDSNHSQFNDKKKATQATSTGKASPLAPQEGVRNTGHQNGSTPSHQTGTAPFSGTSIQHHIPTQIHCQNGTQKGQAAFMEMQTMQTGQQGHRPLVPRMLGVLVRCCRPNIQATASKIRNSEAKTQGRLAGGSLDVATESTRSQSIAQSEAQEGQGQEKQAGSNLRVGPFATISTERSAEGDLCRDRFISTMEPTGARWQRNAIHGCNRSPRLRLDTSGQRVLSGRSLHARKNSKHGEEIRSNQQHHGCGKNGSNSQDPRTDARKIVTAAEQQTEAQNCMDETPVRHHESMARTGCQVHSTARGFLCIDCKGNHGHGNHAHSIRIHEQSSWGEITQTGKNRRRQGEGSHRCGGTGSQETDDIAVQNLHGSCQHRRSNTDRLRQRRGGDQATPQKRTWQWWGRCWLVKIGSSWACLRNSHCLPEQPPRSVTFAETAIETWDGLHNKMPTPSYEDLFNPTFTCLLTSDEYPFQAAQQALNLAFEVFHDRTEEELEYWRQHQLGAPLWGHSVPNSVVAEQSQNLQHYSNDTDNSDEGSEDHFQPLEEAPDEWIKQLWNNVFITQAEAVYPRGPSAITVITWYLDQHRHRICNVPRWISLDEHWDQWEATLRTRWRDRCLANIPIQVHMISPEPPRGTGEFHQIQLIIHQHHESDKATLITAIADHANGPKQAWRSAFSMPSLITKADILQMIPSSIVPSSSSNWAIHDSDVIGYRPYPVPHGASLEVYHITHNAAEEDDIGVQTRTHLHTETSDLTDEVTLMARQPSLIPPAQARRQAANPDESSDTSLENDRNLPIDAYWQPTVLFKLGLDGIEARIRWDDPEVFHRQIAHHIGATRHELITVYSVDSPPQDLEGERTVLLCHRAGEIGPGSTVRYILLDVEFHAHLPDLVPETVRHSKLLPSDITRAMILSMLGLTPYCHSVDDACLLWKNNKYVRYDNRASLGLQHGDYVRIALPPHPRCLNIRTRLAALASHHEWPERDLPALLENLPEDMDLEQIPNPENRIEWMPFRDDVELLQLGRPLVKTNRIPEDVTGKIQQYQAADEANRHAHELHHMQHVPRAITDIHAAVQHAVHQQADDFMNVGIMTWFLSHRTHRRCEQPRYVPLSPNPFEWHHEIEQRWNDELDRLASSSLYIVNPNPYETDPTIAAHVLIVQHLPTDDEQIAMLITMFDNAVNNNQPVRIAVIHSRQVTHVDLLRETDREQVCAWQTAHCTSWHGWTALTTLPFVVARNGDGFGLAVHRHSNTPLDYYTVDMQEVIKAWHSIDESFHLMQFHFDNMQDWHPQSVEWTQLPWWTPSTPTIGFQIYYDGSFLKAHEDAQQQSAGLGIAAFALTPDGWFFAGATSAPIAQASTSYEAELIAALCATKTGYDLMKVTETYQEERPFLAFCYDATTVGHQAEGKWAFHKAPKLGRALRGLYRLVEQRFQIQIQSWHTKGHKGEPGNEMVDVLANKAAKDASTGQPDVTQLVHLIMHTAETTVFDWMWIMFDMARYPQDPHGNLCIPAQPHDAPAINPLQEIMSHTKPAETAKPIQVQLRLCTCNVLSLKTHASPHAQEAEIGMIGPARQEMLLRQLSDAKIHCFALQETRLQQLHQKDARYWLFHHPATARGHYGILVGIHKILPYAKNCCFQEHEIGIVDGSPRHLILRIKTAAIKCIIIAAHAPHKGMPVEDIQSWWEQLSQTIPQQYQGWDRILLADTNARVGDQICQSIGDHGAEPTERKDQPFMDFLRTEDLWLPSTFVECHTGTNHTWQHSSGTKHRIDFVALPLRWRNEEVISWVEDNIDPSLLREDHWPVVAQVTFATATQAQPYHSKILKLAVPDNVCINLFDSPLNAPVPWNVDVHTHAHMLQNSLCDTLQPYQRKQEPKPHKATMTPHTWELIKEKRTVRAHMFKLQQEQRRTLLQKFMTAWRHDTSQDANFTQLLAHQDREIATTQFELRHLGLRVTANLRADDKQFYQQLLQEGQDFLQPGQTKDLWRVVRRALPKAKQRRSQPKPTTLAYLEDQWMPHIIQLEAGQCTDAEQLAEHNCQRSRNRPALPATLQLHELPTVFETEQAIRATKAGKATGIDPIEAQFYQQNAAAIAQTHYQLLLKIFTWASEPLQWKGGVMTMIPKKIGSKEAHHFRGIMLMTVLSKRMHALLRARILQTVAPKRPPGQMGGFTGMQTLFASQALRGFQMLAQHHNISTAVLYIDLRTAFHSLIRETVMGHTDPQAYQAVLQHLQDIATPTEFLEGFKHCQGILAKLGLPPRLLALLQDVHHETWCTIDLFHFIHTRKGTRPGSPIADIIFHCLMIQTGHSIDHWMTQQPLLAEAFDCLQIQLPSLLWADDVAIPICTLRPDALLTVLRDLVKFANHLFESYGFKLNYDPGKTGAVIAFRGQGAAEHRRQLLQLPTPSIECELDDERRQMLHCPPKYKHLGVMQCADGQLNEELKHRVGQACTAFQSIARAVLTNRYLPEKLRLRFFQTLIMSKLFHGMGAWPTLTPQQAHRLQTAMNHMLRRVLRLGHSDHKVPQLDLLRQAELPDVRTLQALTRLSYAAKFFQHAPECIQHTAHMETTASNTAWLTGLKEDLNWLQQTLGGDMPASWEGNLTQFIDYWQMGAPRWPGLLRKAATRARLQETMIEQVHRFHAIILDQLKDAGAEFSHHADQLTEHLIMLKCHCGQQFATNRALLAHQRKKHQMFSAERKFLAGSQCPNCLVEFWTTQRLQQHLAYIPRNGNANACYHALANSGVEFEYQCVKRPKALEGFNRVDSIAVSGPIKPFLDQRWTQLHKYEAQIQQFRHTLQAYDRPDQHDRQGATLKVILTEMTRRWLQTYARRSNWTRREAAAALGDMWLQQLMRFPEQFHEWTAEILVQWGQNDLPDLQASLIDGEAEFVLEDAFAMTAPDLEYYQCKEGIGYLTRQCATLRDQLQEAPRPHRPVQAGLAPPQQKRTGPMPIPILFQTHDQWQKQFGQCKMEILPEDAYQPVWRSPSGCNVCYIIHLFSGHRREGDVHYWAHHMAQERGLHIQVLSVDTAVDATLGDLTHHGSVWPKLLRLYEAHRVTATICGPPCETYTEARFTPAPEGLKWPRPLRSSDRPFGLHGLTVKELRQLACGSFFSLQCLWILALHMSCGGMFLMEHPAMPFAPDRPSVWRLAIVRLLLTHPDLRLNTIQQWRWGAASVKPTSLLAWKLPRLIQDMNVHQIPDLEKPTTTSIGKDANGQFQTAKLKAYPTMLCKAFSNAIVEQISRNLRAGHFTPQQEEDSDREFLTWVQDLLHASAAIRNGAHWLPDYQVRPGWSSLLYIIRERCKIGDKSQNSSKARNENEKWDSNWNFLTNCLCNWPSTRSQFPGVWQSQGPGVTFMQAKRAFHTTPRRRSTPEIDRSTATEFGSQQMAIVQRRRNLVIFLIFFSFFLMDNFASPLRCLQTPQFCEQNLPVDSECFILVCSDGVWDAPQLKKT